MAKIRLSRKHGLGYEGARAMADRLARDLEEQLKGRFHWEESRLVFSRKGAEGWLDVGDDRIDIEIRLGLMLTPMKPAIER
ncbi:MAG: polyhydroxyalkanoic acid system family protein, partial [Chromatiales bacterium]